MIDRYVQFSMAFFDALAATDERLGQAERARGCPCKGRLHRADYPRKVRGIPAAAEYAFRRRVSFCCAEADCRRRRTPPSVRYLGQYVYVGAVVLACCAGWLTAAEAGTEVRTVKRWQTDFPRRMARSRCGRCNGGS